MRIAVAGGTGTLGSYVVEVLRTGGHDPVVLSRGRGVDLVTGAGLDQALDGAQAVIDVSNRITTSRSKAVGFFEAATTNLLAAGHRTGIRHHVAVSIVGIDRVGLGYYAGKLRQEELVLASSRPVSVLRATQFHEFAGQVLQQVPGPVAIVPRARVQPIAAREVAAALAELAIGTPVGMAPELAGPREESLADMGRRLLRARGSRRPVLQARLPVAGASAMASGGLLPTGPGPRGVQTYEDWLAERAR
ncbi:NAD-dependent epimerase/dehydratase family protein [Aeromicrobium sp. NPDC092404]|uniref:SDR family oxidoreductase n=1 Tax=Aeromicrobium sp. NPDC092404 TaxID=3154976 RepID=UPI003413A820